MVDKQPIPAGRYDVNRAPGSSSYIHYSPTPASMEVVVGVIDQLGVNPHRLSQLLGITPSTVYNWRAGTARMSQPYALKCLRLLKLVSEGFPLKMVKSINWKVGLVEYYGDFPSNQDVKHSKVLPERDPNSLHPPTFG